MMGTPKKATWIVVEVVRARCCVGVSLLLVINPDPFQGGEAQSPPNSTIVAVKITCM